MWEETSGQNLNNRDSHIIFNSNDVIYPKGPFGLNSL